MRIEDKKVLSELCKDWAETGIVVDFLEDADATIGDVLSLYAGRPPHWVDGLYKPILDEFLRRKDEPERAREVAAIDDGSPRSLVPNLSISSASAGGANLDSLSDGATPELRPLGWSDMKWRNLSVRSAPPNARDFHCPGCLEDHGLYMVGEFRLSLSPIPDWWLCPMAFVPEYLSFRCEAYQCPCSDVLLLLDPTEWWPVRKRKREVLQLFQDVTVPDLKHCRCNSNDMMFRPCRTCNGSGWWVDGTCWADRLIPEPADKT